MPFLVDGLHPSIPSSDDLLTRVAFDRKQIFVIFAAVRHAVLNVETFTSQLFVAVGTCEVLLMVHFTQGFDTDLMKGGGKER